MTLAPSFSGTSPTTHKVGLYPMAMARRNRQTSGVNKLNHNYLSITQLDKQPGLLSQLVANSREHRRRHRIVRDEFEIERLDRLRNPSKYAGN